MLRTLVRPNTYHDSVKLMRISEALSAEPGVVSAAAVMATPMNLDLLRDEGLLPPEVHAGSEDLLIAVRAEDDAAAENALARVDELLTVRPVSAGAPTTPARSLEQALRSDLHNLAIVAVPGPYAAVEAYTAIRNGLHVFLFSDNVSLQDEVRLKRMAAERDLLMMGPDCGTAILNGVGLGFANRVRRGPVGIVGASGTGIQQVCCLLDLAGAGIAQAIGTGGRDLSAAVGGSMTLRAVEALDRDEDVQVIAVISKPADGETIRRLHGALLGLTKPAVVCLLGETPVSDGSVRYTETLTELAGTVTDLLGLDRPQTYPASVPRLKGYRGGRTRSSWPAGLRVYGLFTGGTLCSEAGRVLDAIEVPHHLVDLGADEYTRGRAHPIIDPRLRASMLAELARREDVGAILVDVILGDLAHPDPAGALVSALEDMQPGGVNGAIPVVAVLVGTREDPQNMERQLSILRQALIPVFPSNAAATRYAAELVRRTPRSTTVGAGKAVQ